jgi:pSer/pThr/pTyr-binding forkhead associated (FHA) protein
MNLDIAYWALRIAIALALYSFLIFALFTLWKDLHQPTEASFALPETHLIPSEGESEGTAYRLDTVNLVGRSSTNTIQLDNPTVSASHARLSFQHGQWWLEDLGSTNGTKVNELTVSDPLVVTYGDIIHFGNLGFIMVRQVDVQVDSSVLTTQTPSDQKE